MVTKAITATTIGINAYKIDFARFAFVSKVATFHNTCCRVISLSFSKLCQLAIIPVLDRSVVASDTAVNFCFFATFRASPMFTGDISVFRAN